MKIFFKKRTEVLSKEKGAATLELLIAFAILILNITAVMLILNGGQSIYVDSETNAEALYKAQSLIEDKKAQAKNDFFSVISDSGPDTSEPPYAKELSVLDLTPCKKEITSSVSWMVPPDRPQKIKFSTLLTDIAGTLALGGDCPTDSPIGGWSIPQTLISRDLQPAGIPATNLDVLNKIIYLTAMPSNFSKDDLFIIDGTDFNAMLAGTVPPITGSLNTSYGLNAVDVVKYNNLEKIYAFAVGYSKDTTGSCGGNKKPYINQLQVIDVTNIISPVLVISKNLSAINPCGEYPAGYSIYYNDEKLYVGTKETAGSELTIFDVSIPTTPSEINNISVNRNVNAIIVRNNLAYLATGPGALGTYNPLKIFDVNPISPTYKQQVGSFTATGNEQGTSLYLIGNKLYLGLERTTSSRPNFFILDISNPTTNPLPILGKTYISLHTDTSITGIRVAGKLAFLTYNDPNPSFQVFDVFSDEENPILISSFNFPQETTGIDYENGFIYTSNKSNDALRILRPAECADTLDNDNDEKIDNKDPECHTDGDVSNTSSYNTENNNE